jgi:hypothetical protein
MAGADAAHGDARGVELLEEGRAPERGRALAQLAGPRGGDGDVPSPRARERAAVVAEAAEVALLFPAVAEG